MVMNVYFLKILSLFLFLIMIAICLSLLILRGRRKSRSSKVEKLLKKKRDLLNDLSGESGASDDEILAELKGIEDIIETEIILDNGAALSNNQLSELRKFYDATGVTDKYLDMLKNSSSWKKRAFAAEKLGQIASARSVPMLLSIIQDTKNEDEDVRGASLRALGRIRDKKAIPVLIEALDCPETWLPPRIGEILVSIGNDAIVYLQKELKNYQSEVRRGWAAEILGWLKAKDAVFQLMECLVDISPEVRAKAAGALGKIKDSSAVDKLLELLISDPIPFVRVRVSQALGSIGHPAVIDYLVNVLKDPEWWVRVRAVEALEQFGENAVSALLIALEDDDREVRRRSAVALERIGYVEKIIKEYRQEEFKPELRNVLFLVARTGVIESLSDKLRGPDSHLTKRIVRILGEAKAEVASNILLELLGKTSDWTLKSRIIESLGRIGTQEAVPVLIECLKDDEYWVRRSSVESLSMLQASNRADDIAEILADPSPLARESALKALSQLKSAKHAEDIIARLNDPSSRVRSTSLSVMRKMKISSDKVRISELLTDNAQEVRIEAVKYFSAVKDRTVLLDVIALLPHGSAELRGEIIEYVRATEPERFLAIAQLLNMDELPKDAILSMIEIAAHVKDNDAQQFILGFIESTDSLFREKAFYEIHRLTFRNKEALLEQGLFDPSEKVRMKVLSGMVVNPSNSVLKKAEVLSRDPDEGVRAALALTYGASEKKEFKTLVLQMCDDPSIRVVAAAFISFASLDNASLPKVLYAKENIKEIKSEIKKIAEDIRFKPAVDEIRKKSRKSTNLVVDLLLSSNDREFTNYLLKILKEVFDQKIRLTAVTLLNIVGTGDIFPAIFGVLKKDPSAEVRAKTMDIVVSLGRDDEVISSLSSMLIDPALKVRIRAAEHLGTYQKTQALEALLHSLDTSDREFREAVTTSLSQLLSGEPERINELIKSIPETKTRKIGMAWLMGKNRKTGSMKFLLDLLNDGDPDVRAAVIGALAKFRRKNLLTSFEKMMYDPNERVRAAAVNAIVSMGSEHAFDVVKAALNDIDEFVRIRAALGLAKLDIKRSIAVIQRKSSKFPDLRSCVSGIKFSAGYANVKFIQNDRLALQVVNELCPLNEMMKNFKQSADKSKRLIALRVLANVHEGDCGNLIESALKDPAPEIRKEAKKYSAMV